MNANKHTPAPWNDEHVTIIYYAPHKADTQECIIIGNNMDATNNDWIALVPHSTDEDKANARLIAAAPELLEALTRLTGAAADLDALTHNLTLPGEVNAALSDLYQSFQNARAAIAKAEGKV